MQKAQPIFIAGVVVGAPAMSIEVLAVSALVLVGISALMFWTDRNRQGGEA